MSPQPSEDSTDRGHTPPDWEDSTVALTAGREVEASGGQSYLLVFQGESSSMFPLPPMGEVTLGRGEGATLRLLDSSVSRMHARIGIASGEARISDLESQNGT